MKIDRKEMPKKLKKPEKVIPTCGIIMPISPIDGCTASHWADVLEIFTDAVEGAGFEANVVSNAEEVTLIHKTIVQNIYDNPIVICDVSGKNPNVMFELGMRLAFDKPTIVVKDDKTTYSFDTGTIEHLEYPRDLRFSVIVDFKEKLRDKVEATYKRATSDPKYTTFLKHFGEFTVAKLDKKEVSSQEFVVEELKSIRSLINRLNNDRLGRAEARVRDVPIIRIKSYDKAGLELCVRNVTEATVNQIAKTVSLRPAVEIVHTRPVGEHFHVYVKLTRPLSETARQSILRVARNVLEH